MVQLTPESLLNNLDTGSILGCMKTRNAFTVFHFRYQKMIFRLIILGSYHRTRNMTKRSAKTQTKNNMLLLAGTKNICGRNEGFVQLVHQFN